MPELGDAWRPLLSTLELHGLVQPLESSTPWRGRRVAYSVTRLGDRVLERLSDD
jgi:DNA-binding PadR family transcriptional regulator